MIIAEQQLARIGFAMEPGEPARWRSTRLDGTVLRESTTEPCSRALMRWRLLLSRNPTRSPYRISRIED